MKFFVAWECHSLDWTLTEKGYHFLHVPASSEIEVELDEYLKRLAEARGIPSRCVVPINCYPIPDNGKKPPHNISEGVDDNVDPLLDEALEFVVKTGRVSTSGVQRQFRIGYARAARIIEQLEDKGFISSPNNNGNREIF